MTGIVSPREKLGWRGTIALNIHRFPSRAPTEEDHGKGRSSCRGLLRPDGSLEVSEKVNLPPGRVRVTVEAAPSSGRPSDIISVLERMLGRPRCARGESRTADQIDARISALRDESEEELREVEELWRTRGSRRVTAVLIYLDSNIVIYLVEQPAAWAPSFRPDQRPPGPRASDGSESPGADGVSGSAPASGDASRYGTTLTSSPRQPWSCSRWASLCTTRQQRSERDTDSAPWTRSIWPQPSRQVAVSSSRTTRG